MQIDHRPGAVTLMTDQEFERLHALTDKLKDFDVDSAYKALKDASLALQKVEKLLKIFSRRRAAWINIPRLGDLPSGQEMAEMLKELGID